jgi:uncharacterized delta-60 repeat protein
MERKRFQSRRSAESHSIFEPLEGRRLMAAGDLDPTFGGGTGRVTAYFGKEWNAVAEDVAVQANGKTVVAGYLWRYDAKRRPLYQMAIARFHVDGSVDRQFGSDGSGKIVWSVGDIDEGQARAVAIQPDGKIVVAGKAGVGKEDAMAVVRFNPNGSFDKTFDRDGRVTVRINDSEAHDLALQKDGKIVVVGTDYSGFFNANDDFAAIRLNPNGSLDKTFDGDGKATVKMGAQDRALAVAIDYSGTPSTNANYGKIVLAGEYRTENFTQYAIARLTTGGKLDTGFAQNGWTRASFKAYNMSIARGVVVQPNGKIVIAGSGGNRSSLNSFQFIMMRFDKNGRIDPIFGTAGLAETGFGGADDAFDVIVSADDGLIVGGRVNRKFALAKYNSIGQLDARFGTGGKVVMTAGDIDAGAGLASTGDGRVVFAGGYNFLTARLSQGLPVVNIINGDREAAETPGDNGSLVIQRDTAYDFPTRVYLNLGGNAQFTTDYQTPISFVGGRYFIDIPAGQMQIEIPVYGLEDDVFEGNENAVFAIAPEGRYEIGSFKDRTVTIADNDSLSINFAPPAPAGILDLGVDNGQVFGRRGRYSFGWDADNAAQARRRNSPGSPDAWYDTYNHMQKNGANRKWEIALPNGMYTVRLVAGDSSATDSVHRMSLEGQVVLSGTPTGDVRWFRSTTNVRVTDGRLTLANAPGAKNNKIAFIDIKAAGLREQAKPVTATLPVRLYGPATSSMWHRKPSGRFADNQIDEPLWP